MKVLIVPSWYPSEDKKLNGIFFKEQVMALKKVGIEPIVAYVDIRSMASFQKQWKLGYSFSTEDGVLTYRYQMYQVLPKVPSGEGKLTLFFLKKLYSKIVKEHGDMDMIHAHSIIYGGYAASVLAKQKNIPFVVTEHNSIYLKDLLTPFQKKVTSLTLQNADAIVTVSEALKKQLKAYTQKTITVIPNIVDVKHFNYQPIAANQKPFIFFSAAFLHKAKGMHELLEAFSKSFKGNKDVLLYIAGDGKERPFLEKFVENEKIQSQVTFLGALSRKEIADWMKKSHVFVLASHFETFGVVFIEALASGRPVIGTMCGGPEEIIHEGNGKLVPIRNTELLASAMKTMKKEYSHYDGEKIRQDCFNRFSEEIVTSKIMRIYERVVSKKR